MNTDKDQTFLSATAAAIRALGRKKDETPAAETLESRGKADARAVHLRHHNPAVHRANAPLSLTARECFDALERARCEALGYREMKGVAQNLHEELESRCEAYAHITERKDMNTAEALYVMARLATTGEDAPAAAAKLAELWQPWLAEELGAEGLNTLANSVSDQTAFAEKSRTLLNQLGLWQSESDETDEPSEEDADEGSADDAQQQPEQKPESSPEQSSESESDESASDEESGQTGTGADETAQGLEEEDSSAAESSDQNPQGGPRDDTQFQPGPDGRYTIYTTRYDEIVHAADLAEPEELDRLRATLDRKLSHMTGAITRLANKLQRKLLARQQRSWQFDLDEGILDTARLSRFIANPTINLVYKQETETRFKDTVVTLLIDNSGSMRGRPIAIAAMCADILARTLERCDVAVEVLGFTTRAWKGGKSRELWICNGRTPEPGRLNDLRHIIYKSAKIPYRRARKNLGLMLKEGILKENIDGEALSWAHNRLSARPEQRKILIVISDGAPVDDATLSANPANILELDLKNVIQWIEKSGKIELLAIGIGHDVTRYYSHAVTIEDASTLAETLTNELIGLFDD